MEMEIEMEHRPGFMLFGFFISPDERPPEPLKPLQPNHRNPDSSKFPSSLTPMKRLQLGRILAAMGVAEDHSPVHFFTRTLYASDVKKGLTRLTIPRNHLLRPFLTDEEEAFLQKRDSNKNLTRLQVDVIDPLFVVRVLNLSRWNYKKSAKQPLPAHTRSWSYALNGGWMDVVDCNGLAAGDTIQVWSFRKSDSSLGFIIFKEDKNTPTPTLTWGKKRKRGSNNTLSTMTTA